MDPDKLLEEISAISRGGVHRLTPDEAYKALQTLAHKTNQLVDHIEMGGREPAHFTRHREIMVAAAIRGEIERGERKAMEIVVINQSTGISDADVQVMTEAVAMQAHNHAAPAWGLVAPAIWWQPVGDPQPPNSLVISVMDNSDQAGALGYHTEGPNGVKYGRVFAEPVLQNGGNALTDPLSVASVLSHEALEAFIDDACNLWADAGSGTAYAYEVGDPVESLSYPIRVVPGGVGQVVEVTVSDFVFPAWFDPSPRLNARFDWMRQLTQPFEVHPQGYVITMTDGTVNQVFGDLYPDWRRATKETETSRTARRLKQGHQE